MTKLSCDILWYEDISVSTTSLSDLIHHLPSVVLLFFLGQRVLIHHCFPAQWKKLTWLCGGVLRPSLMTRGSSWTMESGNCCPSPPATSDFTKMTPTTPTSSSMCVVISVMNDYTHREKWNVKYLAVTSVEPARELMLTDEAADCGESRADSEADTQGCESHNETVFMLSDQWAGC